MVVLKMHYIQRVVVRYGTQQRIDFCINLQGFLNILSFCIQLLMSQFPVLIMLPLKLAKEYCTYEEKYQGMIKHNMI